MAFIYSVAFIQSEVAAKHTLECRFTLNWDWKFMWDYSIVICSWIVHKLLGYLCLISEIFIQSTCLRRIVCCNILMRNKPLTVCPKNKTFWTFYETFARRLKAIRSSEINVRTSLVTVNGQFENKNRSNQPEARDFCQVFQLNFIPSYLGLDYPEFME